MKEYPYKKNNAFTDENSLGNPAAFIMLGDDVLTPRQLLAIGKEHSGFVSEVVFCQNTSNADIKLTYYSSQCEVDFCGHGTIATMYELINSDETLKNKKRLTIETNKKGILPVYNAINEENAVYITAPKAQHLKVNVTKEQIAQALKIKQSDILTALPLDFIDAGLRTLIVPVDGFKAEVEMFPDEARLKVFCLENSIDIILVFCKETKNKQCFAHTRVFAPKFGYLEDPATGSGNSAFANYLLKNNLWDGSAISLEQGGENIAFNKVSVKKLNDDILFGGKATLTIDGKYIIP